MGLVNRQFIYGIIAASFTWIITLYLYSYLVTDAVLHVDLSAIKSQPSLKEKVVASVPVQNATTPGVPGAERPPTEETTPKFDFWDLVNPSYRPNTSNPWEFFVEQGMIKNLKDQEFRDIGYKRHAFNVLVSRNIGRYRQVPDTRHKVCPRKFPDELPSVSVVMCFFNEDLMTLVRSLTSILTRTSPLFLREIILVDDNSYFKNLFGELEEEIANIDPDRLIRMVRNHQREGLIRSRVIGSRIAKGDVVAFLDSHIEVNRDWSEPLLEAIAKDNRTIAVPVIDIINADTFMYTSSPLVRGGFNWGLHFKWDNLPEGTLKTEDSFKGPFISPTMAGGLFAINRLYFREIGEYDMGMDIWGGENIEISFRTWQCGGSIKIYPCSRVGHVFRKRRPYAAPDGSNTMLKNSMRLAHVWMDEYKDTFIETQKLTKTVDFGDIQERIDLRKKLKCKSFSWYLQNVYPELDVPGQNKSKVSVLGKPYFQPWHSRKRKYIDNYLIRLRTTRLCISVDGDKESKTGMWKRGSTLSLEPCDRILSQTWYETDRAELVFDKLYCLEAANSESGGQPILGKCHEMAGDQEWRHMSKRDTAIYNSATGTCLKATKAVAGSPVVLDICSQNTQNSWDLVS